MGRPDTEQPRGLARIRSRRGVLTGAVLGAVGIGGAGLAALGITASGAGRTQAAVQAVRPTTHTFLLTMWGMKPYAVPEGLTAPSITADGKWQNLPVVPPGTPSFFTVHHFVPGSFTINKGDSVVLTVMNLGLHHHGFAIPDLGIDLMKGGPEIKGEGGTPDKGTLRGTAVGGPDARTVTFRADRAGVFPFMCNLPYNRELNYCNPMHDRIIGQLVVL